MWPHALLVRRESLIKVKTTGSWDRLPSVLRIIGKQYKTALVDKVDDQDSDGESDPVSQRIILAKSQTFEPARETTLHELVHAIDHQMGLGLKEKQVEGLGVGIFALMRDNPSFVRWLMAKEVVK